jgi:trigger factor
MKTTVEPLEGNKVKLSVEVDEAEFEKAIDAAFRKIAHEVRIPGFRPGKAPRRILEARIGTEAGRQQALQDALPDYYVRAVVDNEVDVIAPPELNLTAGAEEGPVVFEATVDIRPKVRVPGYDGLEVTIESPVMADAEIDAQVDRMRSAFASVTEVDRQAHPGDHVTIDVTGTIEDQAVPGLTANDYLYEVGAGTVVPELDAHLTGAKAGDLLEFGAAVPGTDGEGSENQIAFQVTVKAVNEKVLPDADDAWASSASEFSTIAALRSDISRRASLMKRVQAHMQVRDEAIKALVELVQDEPPEVLVNGEIERRIQDLAQRLARQGASISQFLEATGQNETALIDETREAAVSAVKADLALRAVAEAEALEADDGDVEAEIERIAKRYQVKPKQARRQLEKSSQIPAVRSDVRKTKALTWLIEKVTVVDKDGAVIDRSLLELNDDDISAAEMVLPELDASVGGSSVDLDEDHSGHDHSGQDHSGHDHGSHEGHDH